MARLDMDNEELTSIAHDFDAILAYVGQVQEVADIDTLQVDVVINVMRDDEVTVTPGSYTEKILQEMPATKDSFMKVKQIL